MNYEGGLQNNILEHSEKNYNMVSGGCLVRFFRVVLSGVWELFCQVSGSCVIRFPGVVLSGF